MKRTQTIVDRERLGSGYIESKQDFSTVLSQVKQLSTTTWKSPWFYGPIGIAVVSVTISIVSLNPSIAKVAESQPKNEKIANTISTSKEIPAKIESATPTEIQRSSPANLLVVKKEKMISEKDLSDPVKSISTETKQDVIHVADKAKIVEVRKVAANNQYPHVDGYFFGEIPMDNLFSENGVQLNSGVEIVSFEFNYFNGKSNVVKYVSGNVVPMEFFPFIENYNLNKIIFITNIKAVDQENRVFTLPSINYKPIKTH